MDEDIQSDEAKRKRKKFKKLCTRIKKQMEFYFSDSNLAKDKFLSDLISRDPDGYVDIEVFKSFNKIKVLTSNCDTDSCVLIAASVGRSNMFEVSVDHMRLRRITPIDLKDFDACTLYVEKLPLHADQKWVQDVFRRFGAIKHVNVPRYKVTNKIKGFGFIEFECADGVKLACEYYKFSSEKECSASEDESKNVKNANKNEEVSEKKTKKSRTRSISESSDKAAFLCVKSDEHKDSPEKKVVDHDSSCQKSKRKRKREDSGSDASIKKLKESNDEDPNSSVIKSEEEPKMEQSVIKVEDSAVQTKVHEEEQVTEVHDSEMNGTGIEESKSKRKRRKRHRSERLCLRVMPKCEWKVYRNKYLELQRATMKFMKKQIMLETQELKEQESHVKAMDVSEGKKSVQFVSDVIIKLNLPNPVKNPSEIKDQVKANAVVAYIDAPVESNEIFIRCHNSDDAQTIVKEEKLSQLGKLEILKGDEEKMYWEKIENDRKAKYSNSVSHKKRGREKLLAKAAKLEEMKNKHIYFDD